MNNSLILSLQLFLLFATNLDAEFVTHDSTSGSKIVGGDVVPLSHAAYQVSLQYRGFHICGGSIISTTFILSAAHCVDKTQLSFLSVRVGTNRLREGGEVINVKKFKTHPMYSTITYSYDFSLLQLESTIKLVPGVKEVILLPAMNEIIPDGVSTLVTGWGDTRNVNESNVLLRGVVIKTINRNICQLAYPTLTDQMICAGDWAGGIDSCQGDSGGPLKRLSDGKLIGIVSWGHGCALPRYPGVYSRVAAVRNWIQSNTRKFL